MSGELTGIVGEIKQTRPFATKAEEAAVALLRTTDLVRRSVAQTVDLGGITFQQYNVLRILRGAGERGLPTLEIADRMIEAAPGITRLIDRLEEKALVIRERCKSDRRQVFCTISKSGLDLLAKLDDPIREADARALASLSETEMITLLDLLERVRAGLAAVSQPPPSDGGP
jgi:DNA-binding MarR family transcriptional regulator